MEAVGGEDGVGAFVRELDFEPSLEGHGLNVDVVTIIAIYYQHIGHARG